MQGAKIQGRFGDNTWYRNSHTVNWEVLEIFFVTVTSNVHPISEGQVVGVQVNLKNEIPWPF